MAAILRSFLGGSNFRISEFQNPGIAIFIESLSDIFRYLVYFVINNFGDRSSRVERGVTTRRRHRGATILEERRKGRKEERKKERKKERKEERKKGRKGGTKRERETRE